MPTDNYFKATKWRATETGFGPDDFIVCFNSSDEIATRNAWERVSTFASRNSLHVTMWKRIHRTGPWSESKVIGDSPKPMRVISQNDAERLTREFGVFSLTPKEEEKPS